MDLAKLSREDMVLAGLALFLIIDLVFLPWYSVDLFGGITVTLSATSAPYAIWGVLAVLAAIAFVVDLALDRFGGVQLPVIGSSRATTRIALAGATLGFMVIKFVVETSALGFGCYLGMVAAIALVVLCVRETAP
ncbi:MAG: hypothetical protein M3071_10385 [Actinomycetota bacterium]|nr:hypothetical protein [Actinomycetota bacterium]